MTLNVCRQHQMFFLEKLKLNFPSLRAVLATKVDVVRLKEYILFYSFINFIFIQTFQHIPI